MPKTKDAILIIPISPITLACPCCHAEPNRDCTTTAGGFVAMHVARIKAAASMDAAKKSKD